MQFGSVSKWGAVCIIPGTLFYCDKVYIRTNLCLSFMCEMRYISRHGLLITSTTILAITLLNLLLKSCTKKREALVWFGIEKMNNSVIYLLRFCLEVLTFKKSLNNLRTINAKIIMKSDQDAWKVEWMFMRRIKYIRIVTYGKPCNRVQFICLIY